jgi:hypothetical protein
MAVAENVGHGQAVVEEAEVEFAFFQGSGNALVIFGAEEIRGRPGMPPGPDVIGTVLGL